MTRPKFGSSSHRNMIAVAIVDRHHGHEHRGAVEPDAPDPAVQRDRDEQPAGHRQRHEQRGVDQAVLDRRLEQRVVRQRLVVGQPDPLRPARSGSSAGTTAAPTRRSGTSPNTKIRHTAGNANAQPAAWSDSGDPAQPPHVRGRPGSCLPAARPSSAAACGVACPSSAATTSPAQRRGHPRVLGDLRPRLQHVLQVRREHARARVLGVELRRSPAAAAPRAWSAGAPVAMRVLQQVGGRRQELQELRATP